MSRARRPLAALAWIATAVLISACGSSTPAATDHVKAEKFAQCMRANGVSAFPDPSASGNFTIEQVANGSSLDTNAPAFKQAIRTCRTLEPTGFTGTKRSSQQQSAGLEFARCVRRNGVPDFPDPTPNSPLIDTNRIPSANQPGGMDLLHAAMQKCSRFAAAAGVTR